LLCCFDQDLRSSGLKIAFSFSGSIQQMKAKRPAKEATASRSKRDNRCPVPRGVLVVIGGKENKGNNNPDDKKKPPDFIRLQVLEAFRDVIDKKEPVVEVVTTASELPEEMFREYQAVFKEIGISKIGHIHHEKREDVLEDPMVERIKKADAFFFAGGNQLKLTGIYGGTDFLTQLKYRYINDHFVVGGTSAGAMALSTPMIYAGNNEVQELSGEIKVTTGLEFLKDVCVDTHFVNRSRFIRMAQVIITNPTCIGIGIEEDTALIVRNGLDVQVVGTSLVIIIDGFNITATNMHDFAADKPIKARDLKMHILSDGDTYKIPQINPPHK
jgi:cyanophycinase